MSDLDDLMSSLGAGAQFSDDAADRLEARLALEPTPRAMGRRRLASSALAIALAATVGGGGLGALIEMGQAASPAPLLPASQSGTAASLLFGEG